jgi:hypothetical protein
MKNTMPILKSICQYLYMATISKLLRKMKKLKNKSARGQIKY